MFLYSTVSTLNPVWEVDKAVPLEMCTRLLTDCGDGGDNFTQLQLIEDSSLTGGIQANLTDTLSSVHPVFMGFKIGIP